jgi:cysteine desulfurase
LASRRSSRGQSVGIKNVARLGKRRDERRFLLEVQVPGRSRRDVRSIYLDYNATTPLAPAVQEGMLPFLAEHYGNPSSGHAVGRAAHAAVEDARSRVAQLLGAAADEIVFTSGGTESNNQALKGLFYLQPTERRHLVITAFEHPAIQVPAAFLRRQGATVTAVGCDRKGAISPSDVEDALRPESFLVSVMLANNEIGSIQPLRAIAEVCHARGVLVHTDAAQAIGKIPVNVQQLGVDLLTIAGHKLYAPKGVGALYIRRGVQLEPLLHGAGHERGLRAGTENVAQVAGLGIAAELAARSLELAARRVEMLRDRLWERLEESIPGISWNAQGAELLPNTLSVNFPQVSGQALLARVPEICASTGAACHTGEALLSDTQRAIGLAPDVARGTVRFSLGRYNDEVEIDRAASLITAAWEAMI